MFFTTSVLFLYETGPYGDFFYMKLVQYNECLVSIVDTDGLVL